MPDRALLLGLETAYHYFNAGVLLFDSTLLATLLTPADVVQYYLQNRVLCRFREQCALNAVLRGRVQYLPGQFNLLSWMRPRQQDNPWHDFACNPMAYCLPDVRDNAAIVHLSAGALPNRLAAERLERFDRYWLLLKQGIEQPQDAPQLPRYAERW
jgi:lipopolysaccharide biosynthesis glycosyltransferase